MMGQGAKMALPTCIIVHEKSSKLNYYHLTYFREYCNTYISQHKHKDFLVFVSQKIPLLQQYLYFQFTYIQKQNLNLL